MLVTVVSLLSVTVAVRVEVDRRVVAIVDVCVTTFISVSVLPDDVKLMIPTPITTIRRAIIATVAIRPPFGLAKIRA